MKKAALFLAGLAIGVVVTLVGVRKDDGNDDTLIPDKTPDDCG